MVNQRPCHIIFTTPREWVAYNFHFTDVHLEKYANRNGKLPIEIGIRAAGPSGIDREVHLKLYDQNDELVDEEAVSVPGKGYFKFNEVTWSGIELLPEDRELRLHVIFIGKSTKKGTAIKDSYGPVSIVSLGLQICRFHYRQHKPLFGNSAYSRS
jgi:hypothetical protein